MIEEALNQKYFQKLKQDKYTLSMMVTQKVLKIYNRNEHRLIESTDRITKNERERRWDIKY